MGSKFMDENEKMITITTKGSSCIISGIMDKPIKFPSQMFPVAGHLEIIHHNNTEPFEEGAETEKLRKVYDSVSPGIGTCYHNIRVLLDACEKEQIKIVPYVGWVIIGGGRPVHHCFATIGNHVLDLAVRPDEFIPKGNEQVLNLEDGRELVANDFVSRIQYMKNSEKSTFGQVSSYEIYLASPCSPEMGLKTFQKLMQAYPKHPCYTNVEKSNGMNLTQKKIYEKMGAHI